MISIQYEKKKKIALLLLILDSCFHFLIIKIIPKRNHCIPLTEQSKLDINLTKYIRWDNDYHKNEKKFKKKHEYLVKNKKPTKTKQKKTESRSSGKGICICLVIKNQFQYIKDFSTFYKNMGVKKIFLYDNSDIDTEDYRLVVSEEIKNSFIEVINIRGYCGIQHIAYNHCYETNKHNFDWFLFIDTDEYIFIEKNKTLIDYLYDDKFNKCNYIKINWRFYTDNNMLHYSKKSVVERFTVPSSFQMLYVKSVIRGGLNDTFYMTAHYPIFLKGCCNPEGRFENPIAFKMRKFFYNKMYIRHYYSKSTEEYCDKINLGCVVTGKYRVKRLIVLYYLINNVTDIKRKMLEKCLKRSGLKKDIKYLYLKYTKYS